MKQYFEAVPSRKTIEAFRRFNAPLRKAMQEDVKEIKNSYKPKRKNGTHR